MNSMLQDIRYALRMLRKNLGLSTAVVLLLAVGIGADTAIFSVVDALLLRPLPYPQPERLANIWLHSPGIGIFRDWPSPGQYLDLRNENHSFDEMAIAQHQGMTLTVLDQPERVDSIRTSSGPVSHARRHCADQRDVQPAVRFYPMRARIFARTSASSAADTSPFRTAFRARQSTLLT
jgi:hypothetical protein